MKFLFILLLIISSNIDKLHANERLSLHSAVNEALENNPEIKAVRARWQASTMRPSQEGSLPNPIVGGKIKNVGFSDITLGEDPRSDIQVFVNQEIPFPGKLSSKEKIALEESESLKWVSDATTRKVIADLKEVYFEWFFVNKAIEITDKNKELLERFTKIAEVKYEVGMGIQQDVLKAQVELSGFIERLEILNEKEQIIEARIKELLNRPQYSSLGQPDETTKSEFTKTLAEIIEATSEQAPELRSSQELIDSKEESLRLAKKQYLPDFIIGGTYFNRDGGNGELDDIWQVSLGLKVPLYFWRKEKFGVQEAALNLIEARESYQSTKNNLLFQVKDRYVTATTADKLTELYQTGIIPQSTLSLESAISGYEVGDIDFLTLLDNLITLFNFEIQYYEQLTVYQKALARIEEITGLELIGNRSNNPEFHVNNHKIQEKTK
ncbi:MAG: TolC family protein [Candidatus Dadabacteria bacterium]|nr:TolC family protein [Candidatus Dadabacteria bacterium]